MNDYLSKPIDSKKLKAMVVEWLDRGSATASAAKATQEPVSNPGSPSSVVPPSPPRVAQPVAPDETGSVAPAVAPVDCPAASPVDESISASADPGEAGIPNFGACGPD
jgi:hypothetical protein